MLRRPSRRRPAAERTLDQVILEYLTNEADQEQLLLVLEGEPDLGAGAAATLALRTSSSKSGQPVAGAQVSVRMISTDRRAARARRSAAPTTRAAFRLCASRSPSSAAAPPR